MGFLIFLWIATKLPEREYAIYIAVFAVIELGLALATLGMDWVGAVNIPQARLKGSGKVLEKLVWWCVFVQAGSLTLCACALFLFASKFAIWLDMHEARNAFQIYAIVLLVEGLSRVLRDQILSCLLLQGAAQISQLIRNATLFIFLLFLFKEHSGRTAEDLAIAEFFASAGSLLLALIFLRRHLPNYRSDASTDYGWIPPKRADMLRAGIYAWLSNLANLTWSGQIVILLVTRLIGTEATAPLGFARNVSEQVRKYMPMELLLSIIRTFLITRYAIEKDLQKLSARVSLLYKVNLFFLLPILSVVIARGEEICGLLSSGRYKESHWLLVGWLSVLVIAAHHRLTDIVAHALARPILTSQASMFLVVTPVFLAGIAQMQKWPPLFLVLLLAEISYSFFVLFRLKTSQWAYHPNFLSLVKFFIACAIASFIVAYLPVQITLENLIAFIVVAYLIVWILIMLLKPWTENEKTIFPLKAKQFIFFK